MSDRRWIQLTRDLHDAIKGTKRNRFGYSIDELSNDMEYGFAETKRYDDESMPTQTPKLPKEEIHTGWKGHYKLADEAKDSGMSTKEFEAFISYCARWDIINPTIENLLQWRDEQEINVQPPKKQVISSMEVKLPLKEIKHRLPKPII